MATIDLEFDASVSAAPAGFKEVIEAAAAVLDALIADPITVTLDVGWGECGGFTMPLTAGAAGGEAGAFYSYAQIEAALKTNAQSSVAKSVAANLPATAPSDVSALGIFVSWAQAEALGLAGADSTRIDGAIGFGTEAYGTDPFAAGSYDYHEIFDAAVHEIGHAMGRDRGDTLMQLLTYTAPGVLAPFQSTAPSPPAYFSVDGGKTELAPWDTTGADTSDFDASIGHDNYGLGGGDGLGSLDITLINALGFHIGTAPVVTGSTLNQVWVPGKQVSFQLPSTTFYEPAGTTLTATLATGAALPSWLVFDAATQTFSGTVPDGFTSLSLSVTATDSAGTATAQFSAYAPPVIANWIPAQSWHVGETIDFQIPAGTYVDPAGLTMTYSAKVWNGDSGTYSTLPDWLHFDPTTQTLSGTVPQAVPDSMTVSIIVYDAAGGVLVEGISISTDAAPSQTALQAIDAFSAGNLPQGEAVIDDAAGVQASLDGLQSLAAAGRLPVIDLIDGGIPAITVTVAQLAADRAVLDDITSNFTLDITAPVTGGAVTGLAGHGNVAIFADSVDSYTVSIGAAGAIEVANLASGAVVSLTGITALQFDNQTEIVAQMPVAGTVTTANITELYSAVLAREPDIAGLAFYQKVLQAAPSTPLLTFAEWFLSSPEYTGNAAHDYAQSADGDAQFVADSYQNLLGRAPEAGAVGFYQTVIAQFTGNLTPGTQAYADAQKLGHAQVLVYFSASSEFLKDVEITASSPADTQHWLLIA